MVLHHIEELAVLGILGRHVEDGTMQTRLMGQLKTRKMEANNTGKGGGKVVRWKKGRRGEGGDCNCCGN